MDVWEKYNLDKNDFEYVSKLPIMNLKYTYRLETSLHDETYINENGILKHVATKPQSLSILLLFLKKYREHPELLPKDIKHEHNATPSETIYKAMQFILTPMKNFDEFKERLLLANQTLPNVYRFRDRDGYSWGKEENKFNYGKEFIFIKDKNEIGKKRLNIYEEEVHWECEKYIYIDPEKHLYEVYEPIERSNRYELDIKFYEESYLYEYLLNLTIGAVRS